MVERSCCITKQSKLVASCGMTVALSVVIMLIGGVIELGAFAAPMIAGLCLIPVERQFGRKYQVAVYMAVSLLCLLLVPNAEANLMYLALFGLYPILYPQFQRLHGAVRWVCKLLYFNTAAVAVETLVVTLLMPEVLTGWMIALLLILGNITFLLYDLILPRAEKMLKRYAALLRRKK